MLKRALVVTPLRIHRLDENVHGAYQRLRVLLEAICGVADDVDLMSLVPVMSDTSADARELASQELLQHWRVQCRVTLGEYVPSRPLRPWILEQARWVLSYRLTREFSAFNNDANVARLRELLAMTPDFVIAHKLSAREFLRSRLPNAIPLLFDIDDIEHIALKRHAELLKDARERAVTRATIPAVKSAVKRSVRGSTRTLVCSEVDKRNLREAFNVDSETIVVAPNACEIRPRSSLPADPSLLFVGTFAWHPNVQAIEFFLSQCWDEIRLSVPDARLDIVGADPEAVPSFSRSPAGVHFTGFVPEIEAAYRKARIVICPILSGGGTRVKLVEAAAFGKSIVSTTIGAEGLEFEDERHVFLRDDASAFTEACVSLLQDDSLCLRLADAAYEHAVENFDRLAVVAKIRNTVYECLATEASSHSQD